MKYPVLALAASLLLAAPASAAESVRAFKGSRTLVKEKHLIPAMKKGDGYGEKYTFNGEFGDRGSFYFSLTISNLGWGDFNMESKGRLTLDGKKFSWKKKLDEDDWKYDKEHFKIQAGPATISGTPEKLILEVEQGDEALKFEFTPIANAWRPMNGQVLFGSAPEISDYTVFPLMNVTGKAKMGGGADWVDVKGVGYGAHTWSSIAVYESARWTLEFRGIQGDATVYLRELAPGGDYDRNERVAYLLVTKGNDVLIESFDFAFTPTEVMTDEKHDNKYKVPESFTVLGKDATEPGRMVRGKVTKKKLRSRKDVLESMNAAVRTVVARYSKPAQYDYDSDFLFEVKVKDQTYRVEGVGRYEVYHLNK